MVGSFPCLAPALPGHGPRLPQSMAVQRGSCAVLGTGASGDKAAGAGLGSGTGGNILPELSAVAAANPSARGSGSASCRSRASTSDEQNNSCFPGSPSRTQSTSQGQWGWGGSWDEAGARQPLACCRRCQSRRQSVTGLGSSPWLQPCVPGMGAWLCRAWAPPCGSQSALLRVTGVFLLSALAVPNVSAGLEMPQNIRPRRGRVLQASWSHGQGCAPRARWGRNSRPGIPSPTAAELPGDMSGIVGGSGARAHRDQSNRSCLRGPQGAASPGGLRERWDGLRVPASSAALRTRRGAALVIGGARERYPRAPQPRPRQEQRPACVGSPRPLHPNPASPALPGAPSPRLPRCPAPPPGRSRCPLSPGALCFRLS